MRRIYSLYCLIVVCALMACSDGQQQRRQLEELEQHNRAGEQLLNDSLAEALADYFDRHGDANERMRSKYMLGRTYYHLGELPRALETYYEAADCADTTSADCDYKVLSRIHAQSAAIFHKQVQPRSEKYELWLAEYYAWRGKDTLQAIECFSNLAVVYYYLKQTDSVIIVCERSSALFEKIGRKDRSSQMKGLAITSLIEMKELGKAKQFVDDYEASSELFVQKDSIFSGHEIYYYMKGEYYLAVHQLDSAEYLFRKELRDGKDLNNQIAGCKGLQQVYEKRKISDSIAKYASLAYELNDSAYNLSEMQNIQKLQASYNYNHQKLLAQQKASEAKIAWLTTMLVALVAAILLWFLYQRYRHYKRASLDSRLSNAAITRRFHQMANSQPVEYPTIQDWAELRALVEQEIPSFKDVINPDNEQPIADFDYDVCIAIRVFLTPIEISKLKQCSPSTVTKTRKRLLSSIFGKEGTADDFDKEIIQLGNSELY